MRAMTTDERAHAAEERDHQRRFAEGAIEAGARSVVEYSAGFHDALTTARWAAAADPDDQVIVRMLRLAGQFGAIVSRSVRAGAAFVAPLDGALRSVAPGLPAELLAATDWAEVLWAATAAADAPSAVRLARDGSGPRADAVAPGDHELATAVASWWRGDSVGPHLIAALRAADPDTASGAEQDRRLDLVTPAVAAFRDLVDPSRGPLDLTGAVESYAGYWTTGSRASDPQGALSLPLAGLSRLAVELGQPGPTPGRGVPAAVLSPDPVAVLLCPVCASPFEPSETTCSWCDTDLRADAPLQTTLGTFLREDVAGCPSCGEPNRVSALRCWKCRASLAR